MKYICEIFLTIFAITNSYSTVTSSTLIRNKRGLFRENLLPETGGKIPNSAFESERISQNLLNQNGFYFLDGTFLQRRHPNRNQFPKRFMPTTIKLNPKKKKYFRPNENEVVAPGLIHTTYLVAKPIQYRIYPQFYYYKQVLPTIPKMSLLLKQRNLQVEKSKHEIESLQIFEELSHYLSKIHESD